jgi:hypothetical protein
MLYINNVLILLFSHKRMNYIYRTKILIIVENITIYQRKDEIKDIWHGLFFICILKFF